MSKCWCCQSIVENGQRRDREAVYRWTTGIGNVVDLCVDCCVMWRANAADDRDLIPTTISLIRLVAPCE